MSTDRTQSRHYTLKKLSVSLLPHRIKFSSLAWQNIDIFHNLALIYSLFRGLPCLFSLQTLKLKHAGLLAAFWIHQALSSLPWLSICLELPFTSPSSECLLSTPPLRPNENATSRKPALTSSKQDFQGPCSPSTHFPLPLGSQSPFFQTSNIVCVTAFRNYYFF